MRCEENRVRELDQNSASARFAARYIDSYATRSVPIGTWVIQYNRIMRAAIRGRKSGRVRGESIQCFASVRSRREGRYIRIRL